MTAASGAARPGAHAPRLIDLRPAAEPFLDAVVDGLSQDRKAIPSKFFYDRRGSELFDRITWLDEYYPTRTEKALLKRFGPEIAERVGADAQLVEFGAGSADKVRLLLAALKELSAYVAIDISRDFLFAEAAELQRAYPDLPVVAICADYTRRLDLPDTGQSRRVGLFPGSTIGNFPRPEAMRFLSTVRRMLDGGAFMVGVDLKKPTEVLNAAYNDAAGVTAEFNLNLLKRANHEIGADFDLAGFEHLAFYNEAEGQIEMHLRSLKPQQVTVAGRVFDFAAGETIHTEISSKYAIDEFQDLARAAGFSPAGIWVDEAGLFSIHFLESA